MDQYVSYIHYIYDITIWYKLFSIHYKIMYIYIVIWLCTYIYMYIIHIYIYIYIYVCIYIYINIYYIYIYRYFCSELFLTSEWWVVEYKDRSTHLCTVVWRICLWMPTLSKYWARYQHPTKPNPHSISMVPKHWNLLDSI